MPALSSVKHRVALPVGAKVILPFLVLSMIAGVIASGLVGLQLASAGRAQLDAEAIREEDSVAASFATFEQRQLTELRTLVATSGVTAAVQAKDSKALEKLIFPAVAAQFPDPLRASVVSATGMELLSARLDPADPSRCLCGSGRTLLDMPFVRDVLQGNSDRYGPKFIGIATEPDGRLLYTVGPIQAGNQTVGAMVLGEPLQALLNDARVRGSFSVELFSPAGQRLAGNVSLSSSIALNTQERGEAVRASGFVHRSIGGTPPAEAFFVPWRLRHITAGYAAVVVPAASLGAVAVGIPILLASIFGAVFLLTLFAGLFISRQITRPLNNLVRATEAVRDGDLAFQAPVLSGDEIGTLTSAFNTMTRALLEDRLRRAADAEAMVQTLAAAIDARDGYTHGHSMRVTEYSVQLARAAGLSEDEVDVLRRGCLVHDIGKIGLSDHLLAKPDALTSRERAEMERHTVIGDEMLRHVDWKPGVLGIVRHHHERWDGKGYPDRLAGTETPKLARLAAVCDTLDAMTSDRPYRRGFAFDEAAAVIMAQSGKQFDPAFVTTFQQARPDLLRLMRQFRRSAGKHSVVRVAPAQPALAS